MAHGHTDEPFALELLRAHLTNADEVGWKCEEGSNPPDLVITWKGGERWGVEVTRSYQQVVAIGNLKVVSSEDVHNMLERFGDELGEELTPICQRNYALCLDIPGHLSSWKGNVEMKKWKREVKEKVRKHVESNASDTLRFRGGTLRPGSSKKPWQTYIGHPPTEIVSATQGMLRHCFEDKGIDLPRWKHNFAQCWLLILNCYVLAESENIESALRKVAAEYADKYRFDGVFWSGYPDRSLVRICLEK